MHKKAYAVVEEYSSGHRLLIADARCPIYWLKKMAREQAKRFPGTKVIAVEVRELR